MDFLIITTFIMGITFAHAEENSAFLKSLTKSETDMAPDILQHSKNDNSTTDPKQQNVTEPHGTKCHIHLTIFLTDFPKKARPFCK